MKKQLTPNESGHWWIWDKKKCEWKVSLVEISYEGQLFSMEPFILVCEMKNQIWGGKCNYPTMKLKK